MLRIKSITDTIRRNHGYREVCLFLLGCYLTFGLIHLHVLQTDSIQSPANITLDFLTIDQHSPYLTQIVSKVIVPPSKLPYNLVDGSREHSHGQAQLIKKLFKGMVGIKYSLYE